MRVQTNYHTRLDMKIKTNCLPKWSNATLITCLDKSHALREKLASSASMSIQLHEMREVHFSLLLLPLLLPLAAWQTHCLIPFCPHSNSNNNIANSSCIEFIFVYHLVPPPSASTSSCEEISILLRADVNCVLCYDMCVCVCCVCLLCWLSSRLRLLSAVCTHCTQCAHKVVFPLSCPQWLY